MPNLLAKSPSSPQSNWSATGSASYGAEIAAASTCEEATELAGQQQLSNTAAMWDLLQNMQQLATGVQNAESPP